MWDAFVELVRETIFAGSHVLGGSLGASIIVISTLVRLALLPLALRAARHARAQQARLAALRPQLERLKRRYQANPQQLFAETQRLYRKHGIRLLSPGSLASAAIQIPLLGALFSAVRSGLGARVRFLWVTDLSRVDGLLVALVTGSAVWAAMLMPEVPGVTYNQRAIAAVIGLTTLAFLWSASSAVALSVGAGSFVSALQGWLIRREAARYRESR
jgi:YidC/Oxa1 family membrane protein insertase